MASRVILDANILVLLAYGSVGRESLGKKRRVRAYLPDDFDVACRCISGFRQVVVTPNVIMECSDLLADAGDENEKLWLKTFLEPSGGVRIERYVPSAEAASLEQYAYLGVADCSLLRLLDEDTVLLTADAKL